MFILSQKAFDDARDIWAKEWVQSGGLNEVKAEYAVIPRKFTLLNARDRARNQYNKDLEAAYRNALNQFKKDLQTK